MPSLVMKRGKPRYVGTVYAEGVRGPTKLFPDDSKKSYREAAAWEKTETDRLRKKIKDQRAAETATGSLNKCIRIDSWTDDYLDWIMDNDYADKTYHEKKAAMKILADHPGVSPDLPVDAIDRFVAARLFDAQLKTRSGNAVNKDRKNLGAAWQWGRDHYRNWPRGDNPFLIVPKKSETRQPRYVPPESDFWAVYDHVAGLAEDGTDVHVQDRVMLLAYLHLAARRTELFRTRLSDVDLSRRSVRLWTRKREGGAWEYDILPLTRELTSELTAWLQRRMAQATEDKEHLFVCLSPQPVNEQYFGLPFLKRSHIMARWCKQANVTKFGWHGIRHLTASTLYRRGYNVSHIQAVLRHKSATTTSRYLRSLGIDEVRDTLDQGLTRDDSTAQIIPFQQKKTASGPTS